MGFIGDYRAMSAVKFANDTATATAENSQTNALAVDEAAVQQGQEVAWGAKVAPVEVSAAYTSYSVSGCEVNGTTRRSELAS